MKGKIDGLIVDEVQDYCNDSGQGEAMFELLLASKKTICMTGTLLNGYSEGVFRLLYRIATALMVIDDKQYADTQDFNKEYGVSDHIYELDSPEYNQNRRSIKSSARVKQLPGISPLIYTRFLMEFTSFLTLNDLGKHLPEYEEIPVELKLAKRVEVGYKVIEDEFISIMKDDKRIAKKVQSAFVNLLTVYPDQPYNMNPIVHPITGEDLIEPPNLSCIDELNEKDLWILEKVKEKINQGSKVIIYTNWVRTDTQQKLLNLLKKNNIKAVVLKSTTAPEIREEWVENQVKSGIQVLITNPELVSVGLDLNDFPTLIYYNIAYKLFTLRQSSRRSWRINQKAPRVEVYFLYFKDVIQQRALRLMASKLSAAGIIEGNLSDEGLAAMSECQDMMSLLAQELSNGIKNDVEDLSATFKKMAFINPKTTQIIQKNEIETSAKQSDTTSIEHISQKSQISPLEIEKEKLPDTLGIKTVSEVIAANEALINEYNVLNKKKARAIQKDENQLSLFDIFRSA